VRRRQETQPPDDHAALRADVERLVAREIDRLRARVHNPEHEERERRRLAVPACACCGLAYSARWTSAVGLMCNDCHLDADGLIPRTADELADILAWRLLTDTWTYRHLTWVPGLAAKVGFTWFKDADATPAPRRFAHLDVERLRDRHGFMPEARPPEPERCETCGDHLRDTWRPVPGRNFEERAKFCRSCDRVVLTTLQAGSMRPNEETLRTWQQTDLKSWKNEDLKRAGTR
jgi:hypothetical protein